jgi:hypothetical protein
MRRAQLRTAWWKRSRSPTSWVASQRTRRGRQQLSAAAAAGKPGVHGRVWPCWRPRRCTSRATRTSSRTRLRVLASRVRGRARAAAARAASQGWWMLLWTFSQRKRTQLVRAKRLTRWLSRASREEGRGRAWSRTASAWPLATAFQPWRCLARGPWERLRRQQLCRCGPAPRHERAGVSPWLLVLSCQSYRRCPPSAHTLCLAIRMQP